MNPTVHCTCMKLEEVGLYNDQGPIHFCSRDYIKGKHACAITRYGTI